MTIFHIALRADWDAGGYVPASLASEGFVHLSTGEQLDDTLRLYFAGCSVALVEIEPDRLTAELKWEPPAGPHDVLEGPAIHGELQDPAVVSDPKKLRELTKLRSELEPVVQAFPQNTRLKAKLDSLR